MKYAKLLLLALSLTTLSACGAGNAETPPRKAPPAPGIPNTSTARPFHLTGTVKTSQGKPLAGVRVGADNTVLDGSEVWTTTDAQGRYDLDLSAMPILNSWTAVANLTVTSHGQQYTLYPEVDNPAAFLGKDGAVRHFTLRLTGKTPNGGYYGARLFANLGLSEAGDMPEFDDVEFTATPDGPLLDGTAGTPVTLRWAQLPFEVPQGTYVVTARSLSGKGPLWLKARGGSYGPRATVAMEYTAGTGMTLNVDVVQPR
ncbi:carboxypeptidase-like regulatory domain-containing protein [Deinococcus radiopugnans]|uniref:Carboxypeptidase regulatory-like domain-containing protein n=1 Tax=Deinococcus radiopugnans ATCC 19172 TaxID=585398 RepID=A0A5C4XYF7_9DEIO|nr:carboxypeptidase-like regulatory domain-containing protein [Deinococcus radiopugnans]MBB6018185.1 hypothetical protein [Deinococcus radiopugnans ATCC 19172]TNM68155.1 carboxypeptidase regulatory-like domain-containing protein [Deinococcus radiopugnans ATCC 19172]